MITLDQVRLEYAPRAAGGQSSLFLRGPVNWRWLELCARLPGKALQVGLVILLLAGMCKSERVRLGHKYLRTMGVKRHAAYRALRSLEEAGLITVTRRRGASPEVTAIGAVRWSKGQPGGRRRELRIVRG
jgi:hypothetical protein